MVESLTLWNPYLRPATDSARELDQVVSSCMRQLPTCEQKIISSPTLRGARRVGGLLQSMGDVESALLRNCEDGSLSPEPSPFGPFSQALLRFPLLFSPLSVIDKFDYVFAENGTVQYKNGQLVSKQVGPAPLAATALLPRPRAAPVPCALWGAAPGPGQMGSRFSSPQMPDLNVPLLQVMFSGGLHRRSSFFLTPPFPPAGHSGPLRGRAAAGSNQLLSQLHGAAEAAQETVMAQACANGSHITDS